MNTLRKFVCLTVAACLMLVVTVAWADFSFPTGLAEIGEEAFQGNPTLTLLEIPEGVTTIGDRVFADCTSLNAVMIPDSVAVIGEDAFANCGEALLIRTAADSVAHSYAVNNWIDYDADTTRRALIIGQTYTGTQWALQGPANDMRAMRFCLSNMEWSVNAVSNQSAAGILSAISNTFSTATERDISLFYYSGHGEEDGSLIGKSGTDFVTPAQLRDALDSIPGRKIVIVDACYSGQLIAEENGSGNSDMLLLHGTNASESQTDHAAQFISAFQSVFRKIWLNGVLNAGSYYVITAARENEKSEEGFITSGGSTKTMGFFTYAICLGLGYNGVTMQNTTLVADQNGDQAVSIQEAYQWAKQHAQGSNGKQHAVVWPTGCRWFAPFRP